ncbi:Thimet oligopeptidase [Talaromyces pinophilus]|nr:Thimet oligopeptidase [Talaromyces pinophilus]
METSHLPRRPPQTAPPLSHTPAAVRESVARLLSQSRNLHDQLVNISDKEISWETGIAPLAYHESRVSTETNILKFYQYASPNADLRAASREAAQELEAFEIEKYLRDDLFKIVDTIKKDPLSESLDIESRHYLDSEYRKYVANGLGLEPGPQRDRFKEIKKRMNVLSVEFQSNLDEDSGEISFSIQDLDGVPADVINRLEKDSEQDDMVKATLQYADYFPIMDNARNSDTRKRLFLAFENKCKDNVTLFREMMILRDEAARLLGYANYAAYQLEGRLVTSLEKVNSFLDDLLLKLADPGAEEIKRLKALKIADMGGEPTEGEQYYLWDHRYYNRLLLEKEYQLDYQQITEFFPLHKTFKGMIDIFSNLFGLIFHEVDVSHQREDLPWHPDVRIFHVWDDDDEGGEFSLSHHYETGESIPQSIVDNLVRVKGVNSGLFYLRQLHVSIFDLHIHQPLSHTSILATNITSIYNSLWQSITQMAGPDSSSDTGGNDWGHGYATFFHLLSDYGAGYYSYLLAEVYALDMFYFAFKSDPLNPEQGRRYRHMVLEKGGSQPEMKTLGDFLGREASTQAFYEELAIK